MSHATKNQWPMKSLRKLNKVHFAISNGQACASIKNKRNCISICRKNAEGSYKRLTLEEKFKSGLSGMKFLDSTVALFLKRSSNKSRD